MGEFDDLSSVQTSEYNFSLQVSPVNKFINRFFGVFMDLDPVSLHKDAEKEANTQPPTEQALSIKGFIIHGKRRLFSWGIQRVIPSGQDFAILPARVANHRARFGLSRLLTELAI